MTAIGGLGLILNVRGGGGARGDLFAVRYVTLPFSPDRRTARTTRIDLREGEVETPP